MGGSKRGVSFCLAAQLLAPLSPFPDVEWMPIHTRAYVGTLIGYVYSVGQFILAGVAYAVPHWRHLQLLVSVPFFVAFVYSWYVGSGVGSNDPEWLQGTGHLPELGTNFPRKFIQDRKLTPIQCFC